MLELNREYNYAEICDEMGWEMVSGGGKRQRQLEAVKRAYEWYHPVNPKTGKQSSKLYIFTKKLSDVVYEDGRKRNGREPIIPEKDFETLLAHTVKTYGFEFLPIADSETRVLLFTSKLYKGFGFDVYGALNRLRKATGTASGNKLIDTILSSCVTSKAYAYSIKRIANFMGVEKNSLPKEVVYKMDSSTPYIIASEELASEFEEERGLWEYILTAQGTIPADGKIAMASRNIARKDLLEKVDLLDTRTANSIVIPTALLETNIPPMELEQSQIKYFDAVLSGVRRQIESLLEKELWGNFINVEDSDRDALKNYLARFDEIAQEFGPSHLG